MKRFLTLLLPFIGFLGLSVFLYLGLYSDPTQRESTVLEKPFPAFELPDLDDPERLFTNQIFNGKVTLVNVWGVWCKTCAIELPYLTMLSEQGLTVVGLYYDQSLDPNFGDKTLTRVQTEVQQIIQRYGDPFAFNIFDVYRDTALDLGVTGAPESFLVDQDGMIRVHHLGDINPRVWRTKFSPVLAMLDQQIENNIQQLNLNLSEANTGINP